jgi:urea transport system permease protein
MTVGWVSKAPPITPKAASAKARVFWLLFPKRHISSLCLAACLLICVPTLCRADDTALANLHSSDYDTVAAAVTDLAAHGNPRARAIITALRDGALCAPDSGPGLYISVPNGYVDAATGAAVSGIDPDSVSPIQENNRVRVAVAGALALLDLSSPNAATRRAAADAMLDHPDSALLPALDQALAREPDRRTHGAIALARAASLLSAGAAAQSQQSQLEAVATLRAEGTQQARAILLSIPNPPPAVKDAAKSAIASIDFKLRLWSVGQGVFYGASLGSVLLIAALGLAITFGVMGVINMAHGELMMIGAYVTWLVQGATTTAFPGQAGLGLALSVPAAFLVCGALGVAIERGLIRFLYGRPLETLLATWGLSLVLQQAVRSLFGPTNVAVITPAFMSGAVKLGGIEITLNRLVIIVFAALVMVGLTAVLRLTPLGLQMRAVTQNRRMAALMGIRTTQVDALTFGLGSGVAGLAGVAISQIDNVSPNLGQGYIIDSFMVVVFGGVGNLWGTLAGALSLGIANKILEPLAGAVLAKIVVLVLIILFIQRRPRGLFPLRGRAVES